MINFVKTCLPLLGPTGLSLILLTAGLLLLLRPRKAGFKWGRRLCLAGFLVLLCGSNPWVGRGRLAKLQHRYPPVPEHGSGAVDYVVVLGGGATPREEGFPANLELSQTSLSRLVEGIRLHLAAKESILVLSGQGPTSKTEASVMQRVAESLGIPADAIELDEESMNTAEQALRLRPRLEGSRFYLVTSAEHMPRAMAAFEEGGLAPIAAPTGHDTYPEEANLRNVIGMPHSKNLRAADRVLYEWLATPRTKWQVRKARGEVSPVEVPNATSVGAPSL